MATTELPALARRLAGVVLLTLVVGLVAVAHARADPLLAAAGDIACAPPQGNDPNFCQQGATASTILAAHPDAVLALGDNQYQPGPFPNSTQADFNSSGGFNDTWGQFKPLIAPVPGNHEYNGSPTAAPYFGYFNSAAGPPSGYYSYDIGGWHMIALNSACSDALTPSCDNRDPGAVTANEVSWLRADLAAHPGVCTLAYWHHPLFTSGVPESPGVSPLWQALYDAHADVVLNGHTHAYERFALQDPARAPTPAGIREFVVGSGGVNHQSLGPAVPNEQASDTTHFGVLFLTVHPTGYEWSFNGTVPGSLPIDSGSAPCHVAATITSPADGSYSLTHDVALSGTAEAGRPVTVYENGSARGSTTAGADGHWSTTVTGESDGTHTLTARATNAATVPGPGTNQVRVTVDTIAPPPPVISSPADGSSVNSHDVALTGSAEPSSLVSVTDETGGQHFVTATSAGAWSLALAGLADGHHVYSATATDAASNTGPSSSPVHLSVNTLTVSALSTSHKRLVVAGSHRRGPHGTTFRLRLSEPAQVRITIIALRTGRRAGRSCVAPTRRVHHRHSCTRFAVVTTLTLTGGAGANAVMFSGRVHGRPLARGRYKASVQASGPGGPSGAQTVGFTILG